MAINRSNDFVSKLKQKCDAKVWEIRYDDKDLRTKPSDAPQFQVVCQVFPGNGNQIQGVGTARTKKEAKHLAAKGVLIQLDLLPADENAFVPVNQNTSGSAAQYQVPKPTFLQNQNRDNSEKSVSEVRVADVNAFCSVVGEPLSPKKPRLDVSVVDVPAEQPQVAAEILLENSLDGQQKRPNVLVSMASSTTKEELLKEHGRADQPKQKIECRQSRELCRKAVDHIHHRFLSLTVNEYISEKTRFETLSEVDKTLKLLASQNDDCFSHRYKIIPSRAGKYHSFCYLDYDPKGKVGGDTSSFLGDGFSQEDAQRAAGEAAIAFLRCVAD